MTSEPCISLGQQDEQIYGKEVSRANRITKRNVLEQEILIEILLPRDNFRHHSHRVATHHSAKDSGLVWGCISRRQVSARDNVDAINMMEEYSRISAWPAPYHVNATTKSPLSYHGD